MACDHVPLRPDGQNRSPVRRQLVAVPGQRLRPGALLRRRGYPLRLRAAGGAAGGFPSRHAIRSVSR